MKKLMRRLLIGAAMGVAQAGADTAEPTVETPDDEKLPASTVIAKRPAVPAISEPSPGFAAAKARALATPGAVTVVSSDAYKIGRAATLQDMMEFRPGVFTQTRSGQESFRISIRGSGIQRTIGSRGLLMLQDGLPLNNADGSFSVENLDPSAFSRLEIRRGASAMGSGSGTLGGSVNFVTYTGIDAPAARLGAEAGSYGFVRLSGTGSVRDLEDAPGVDATATLTLTSSDGWRDFSDSSALRFNANLGQRFGKGGENRLYVSFLEMDSLLPGALTLSQLETNPRQAAAANIANPSAMDVDWVRIADRVSYAFDDARVEFSGGWQGRSIDHPAGPTTSGTGNDDAFFQARLDYLADLDGRKNRFTLGVTPSFGVTNSRAYVNPPGDARRGAKVQDTDERATSLAVFAEEDHCFTGGFAGTLGARIDYARRERRINLSNPATLSPDDARTKEYSGVSPSVGARYEFDRARQQVYVNLSRSFEAPAFLEFNTRRINNPQTVDAQTATTLEVGTRGTRGMFGWDAAAYASRLENEFITYNTPTPANPLATSTINGDETRHFGVEFGIEINLLGGDLDADETMLLFRHTLGWNRYRFHDDVQFGDNTIAGLPEISDRTELIFRHKSGFYIGPNVEYVGSTYIDNVNSLKADSFAILGARAGYRKSPKGLSCYVEVRNILDKKYSATSSVVVRANPSAALYNPGQGLSAYAGIEYRW